MAVTVHTPDVNQKTVIHATDFSLCSRNAGLYAASIASFASANLLMAHVFTRSQAALEVEISDRHISQQRTSRLRQTSQFTRSPYPMRTSYSPGERWTQPAPHYGA